MMEGRSLEPPSLLTDDGLEKPPFSALSYSSFVRSLCPRNPSLRNLDGFLFDPNVPKHGCRVVALDFLEGHLHPFVNSEIDAVQLRNELHGDPSISGAKDPVRKFRGRILILEDLTKEVIETLGSELDIDPLFFALHLHAVRRTGMRHQTPDDANLPSRISSQDYTSMVYHRAITCDTVSPYGGRLQRDTVIDRKLVFLRSTTVGLIQHVVSVLRTKTKGGSWLGLILVDPEISDWYYLEGQKRDSQNKVQVSSEPFLGPYEDFLPPPRYSNTYEEFSYNVSSGLFDDLQYYWSCSIPDCFDPTDPSLQSLAYYPLKIVAAEWVKYVEVMQYCIKQYEYRPDRLPNLEQFNTNLRELQGWRRRTMVSQGKVKTLQRLLHPRSFKTYKLDNQIEALSQDLELIQSKMESAGRTLENTLSVVMTSVQIADTRRNFAETANISRLTILALIFVPLTFVASLFSMNTQNMPGSGEFWVYFAVAIPVTILVVLIAKPPVDQVRGFISWMNERKKRPIPRIRSSVEHQSRADTHA